MIGPVAGAGESMPRSTEYVSWEFSRGLPGLRVEAGEMQTDSTRQAHAKKLVFMAVLPIQASGDIF